MTEKPLDRQRILDRAIELAQQSSWASLNFSQLADSLNCSLADIGQHFRSKDDMAEAFFDRADRVMWALSSNKAYRNLTEEDKLFECIMCWFESLTPYKPLVKEMLGYKLEPGHFHLQGHGITRISRTVQWFLDVAEREHGGLKRSADELAVTSAYLTSFSCFLFDKSEGHRKTRALLKRLLHQIDQGHKLFTFGSKDHAGSGENKDAT